MGVEPFQESCSGYQLGKLTHRGDKRRLQREEAVYVVCHLFLERGYFYLVTALVVHGIVEFQLFRVIEVYCEAEPKQTLILVDCERIGGLVFFRIEPVFPVPAYRPEVEAAHRTQSFRAYLVEGIVELLAEEEPVFHVPKGLFRGDEPILLSVLEGDVDNVVPGVFIVLHVDTLDIGHGFRQGEERLAVRGEGGDQGRIPEEDHPVGLCRRGGQVLHQDMCVQIIIRVDAEQPICLVEIFLLAHEVSLGIVDDRPAVAGREIDRLGGGVQPSGER